jgi:hypothetical protein
VVVAELRPERVTDEVVVAVGAVGALLGLHDDRRRVLRDLGEHGRRGGTLLVEVGQLRLLRTQLGDALVELRDLGTGLVERDGLVGGQLGTLFGLGASEDVLDLLVCGLALLERGRDERADLLQHGGTSKVQGGGWGFTGCASGARRWCPDLRGPACGAA